MAVHIRLVKNNIKNNNSYGKYFAKAVSQGEVTMKELAEEAALNSGISRANFIRGQTVVIEGIGRFSLRVESIGVDDPKQFNISRHITRFVCKFLPTGKRINIGHGTKNGQILYDFSKDVKAVWQHGFKP